jgi:hypothetical protein
MYIPKQLKTPQGLTLELQFLHVAPDTTICWLRINENERRKAYFRYIPRKGQGSMPKMQRKKYALAAVMRKFPSLRVSREQRTTLWTELFAATKEITGRDWML